MQIQRRQGGTRWTMRSSMCKDVGHTCHMQNGCGGNYFTEDTKHPYGRKGQLCVLVYYLLETTTSQTWIGMRRLTIDHV